MKKILLIIVIAFILWFILSGGLHPEFHRFQGVTKVVLRVTHCEDTNAWPNSEYKVTTNMYGKDVTFYERHLTQAEEIADLRETLGVTWDGYVPLHSYESPGPRYTIYIVDSNGHTQILFFSTYEWGSAGSTPKRMIDYMKEQMR